MCITYIKLELLTHLSHFQARTLYSDYQILVCSCPTFCSNYNYKPSVLIWNTCHSFKGN